MGPLDVVAPNRLDTLPARPPTPPREAGHLASRAKQKLPSNGLDPRRRQSLHTPPSVHSPSSATTGSTIRKKVNFSAEAEYREAPLYPSDDNVRQHPTPVSNPPSSSASLPIKSILKVPVAAYDQNPLDPTNGTGPDGINLATMLESTIQQLAGPDRGLRVDAYMMLVRALKASKNLPDRIALQGKMTLFMQFIQRDITKTPGGTPETSLANHALTLLSTFLHFPAIASTLSNEFGVFIIDHCVRNLEDTSVSKDMARHLMQVIALQNFPPKVMTSDRVGKLVTVLHNLPDHIRDKKGIYMARIHIYRRFVRQCKYHMIQHSDWLLDLFEGMLSSVKEIRAAAIDLGKDAAFATINEKQMSKKVMELLQRPAPTEEDGTYIEYYAERLGVMVKGKEESEMRSVPQIWSVVMLFIRGHERWNHWRSWLELIQLCFNSSDFLTKHEANHAWCRLVYAMNAADRSCSIKIIPTLSQPLVALLHRRSTGKQADELRRVVLGSICMLYYYAFRPQANLANLEAWWENSVKPVMRHLTERRPDEGKDNCAQACAILTALFDCATPRIWKEDRIVDSPLVAPEELPAIDAKWLRHNAAKAFAVVEPILKKNWFELCNTRSATHKMWRTLIGAMASAAAKEIKVSPDMASFLGQAFGMLKRIWADGVSVSTGGGNGGSGLPAQFLASTREFILVMVEKLGRLPFTEKVLAVSKENTFVPVSTPSHRSGAHQSISRPSLHHLFSILSSLPPGVPDNEDFADFFKSIFAPFLSARDAKSRRNQAQEMLHMIPTDALCPSGPWILAAEAFSAALEPSQNSSSRLGSHPGGGDPSLGQEYRDVVKVLERGLKSTPNLPWQQWQSLFCTLTDRVRDDTGDAGLALAVIEPLAKALLDSMTEEQPLARNAVEAFVELLSVSNQPRDRQAVEAARRRLWGTSTPGPRSASFDQFDSLYRLSCAMLARLYDDFDLHDPDASTVPALKEVWNFLGRCNRHLTIQTLASLQDGLAPWIRDEKTRLNSRQFSTATEATKTLWDRACTLLREMEQPQTMPLASIETLLCAAFESKHRHILNTVSTMWNTVFDKVESIDYPQKLKALLLSRQPFVDIVLPGLETPRSSAGFGAQRPTFIDSQQDMDVLNSTASTSRSKSGQLLSSASKESRKPQDSSPWSDRSRRSSAAVTKKSSGKGRKKHVPPTPTPRLRHDDSQIQFAPIESSPNDRVAQESQVLTDRQLEVRDRQRATVSLFPDIRSSPSRETESFVQTSSPRVSDQDQPQLPAQADETHAQGPDVQNDGEPSPLPSLPRAATPQHNGHFDDYISSTPTPRRGQPPPIADADDNGAGDPPSSPPEARRYLLPEISSRASSDRIVDEWHFESSSPISGSPNPVHRRDAASPVVFANSPAKASDQDDDLVVDETYYGSLGESQDPAHDVFFEDPVPTSQALAVDVAAPENSMTTSEEPNQILESPVDNTASPRPSKKTVGKEVPSTPRRSMRTKALQETPKSDNEVFMDALTSPQPPSSTTKPVLGQLSQGQSFALVVQLDGKKRNPPNLIEPTPSPEKPQDAELEAELGLGAMECITVGGGDSKRGPGRPRKRRSTGRLRQSSPVEPQALTPTISSGPMLVDPTTDSSRYSQDTTPSGRRKRRRWPSSAGAPSSSPKKPKYSSPVEPGSAEVPDSQPETTDQARTQISEDARELQHAQNVGQGAIAPCQPEDDLSHVSITEMEVDPEVALQSQIELEQAEVERRIRGTASSSLECSGSGNSEEMEEHEQANDGPRVDGEENEVVSSPAVDGSGEAGPPKSTFQMIVAMLQGGLGALKSANLSRREVSEIEDVCFEIKHELYAAGRRGRK